MLLTFFTTHIFQFRFGELSIVGTPKHPPFVMSCSARHSVLWELGTSSFLRSRIRCWLILNRSPRHLECTCQWINIVPVTVLLSSIIEPSNFEDVPVNMPGRTPWTRLAQKALRGLKVATPSLNWIPLSSTFGHGVSVLASGRLPYLGYAPGHSFLASVDGSRWSSLESSCLRSTLLPFSVRMCSKSLFDRSLERLRVDADVDAPKQDGSTHLLIAALRDQSRLPCCTSATADRRAVSPGCRFGSLETCDSPLRRCDCHAKGNFKSCVKPNDFYSMCSSRLTFQTHPGGTFVEYLAACPFSCRWGSLKQLWVGSSEFALDRAE